MLITIPEDFQTFVARGIDSGRFRSAEEVICEGLNLLRDKERKLEALRADLQVGLDQLDAGQSTLFDAEDINRRDRQRLASSGNKD